MNCDIQRVDKWCALFFGNKHHNRRNMRYFTRFTTIIRIYIICFEHPYDDNLYHDDVGKIVQEITQEEAEKYR